MRSDKKNTMAISSFNQNVFNQISVKGLIRDVGEKNAMRLLK